MITNRKLFSTAADAVVDALALSDEPYALCDECRRQACCDGVRREGASGSCRLRDFLRDASITTGLLKRSADDARSILAGLEV